MKSVFAALILTLASSAFATTPVKSELDQPVCLKREYTEDHMRANPKQLLSTMYVLLTTQKKTYEGETFIHSGAEVYAHGTNTPNPQLYVNREPTCEARPDGTTFCFAECDGGSFELVPRASDALFRVSKDYYFPLFKNGFDRETATEKETLELNHSDAHNNVYKLYTAPVRECLAIKKVAKKMNGGC